MTPIKFTIGVYATPNTWEIPITPAFNSIWIGDISLLLKVDSAKKTKKQKYFKKSF